MYTISRCALLWAATLARVSGRGSRGRRHLSTDRLASESFPDDFYWRQLTPGKDVALDPSNSLAQVATSMGNFYYAIGDKNTGEAFVIDACWVVNDIVSTVENDNMTVVAALATHYHYDHIGAEAKNFGTGNTRIPGIFELSTEFGLPVHVPELELGLAAKQTGLDESALTPLSEVECLHVGRFKLTFLHTPGHSPGSTVIRVTGESGDAPERSGVDLLIAGDTVFPGSCGRLDLPGSDPYVMYDSLQRLSSLPDSLPVYPGHGYGGSETTIGREKASGYLSPGITRGQWNAHMAR